MAIDLTNILTKCCNTLVHLELHLGYKATYGLDLQHQLQSLNYLSVSFAPKCDELYLKNLLSKCSGRLRTLKLHLFYKTNKTDFSSLLEQTLKITALEILSDEAQWSK
jgi:hypothetical protein